MKVTKLKPSPPSETSRFIAGLIAAVFGVIAIAQAVLGDWGDALYAVALAIAWTLAWSANRSAIYWHSRLLAERYVVTVKERDQ